VENVGKKLKMKVHGNTEEFGNILFLHPHKVETVLKEEQRKIF
jgi:hypothetical protein